ncbi:FAD/NAD(P)-binding domain-containing protein [Wolfiporia cocos MD-104 SS10]|uniref:FAD/NAD(P)-binding domain-containing protein n=1 Tax=Wolfiporia cocos (strain MD-104) TaxID=742152 RepID=A0A2H3JM50_WOLCO|nr:FAD/NAD(P)-binding domain-containing protein [Wolfiporia cocos MD-104 SS10]
MHSQRTSDVSPQAPLAVDFLIIGGGIAGLSCALALARVGHRVLVLEKGDGLNNRGGGGMRVPPNMSKVLFHWGLKPVLRRVALTSTPILFSKFHTGEILGIQKWDDELLRETRGEFMLMTHHDLYQVIYDAAVALGVKIRFNVEVADIDPDERAVQLANGEILTADVLIGADGEKGMCRRLMFDGRERVQPTGYTIYDVTFSALRAMEKMDDETKKLVKFEDNTVFAAFGNRMGASGYPIGNREKLAFHFFMPEESTDAAYGDPPATGLKDLVRDQCDARLKVVVDEATDVHRLSVNNHENLDDWVHDSSNLVVVGQAAHPIAPGGIQGTAMVIEDAAVLAKLFSHLHSKDQISNFLYAFQDLRQKRCYEAHESELGMIMLFTMEDGPEQEERDRSMQEKYRAGKNVFDAGDSDMGAEGGEQWTQIRTIFGYDCEDEADNWWVQWGLLRERAQSGSQPNGRQSQAGAFDWSAVQIVDQDTSEPTPNGLMTIRC